MASERILNEYELPVKFFVDNDESKKEYSGKKVYSPNEINPVEGEWYVLAMKEFTAPYRQLIDQKVSEDRIIIGDYLYLE